MLPRIRAVYQTDAAARQVKTKPTPPSDKDLLRPYGATVMPRIRATTAAWEA